MSSNTISHQCLKSQKERSDYRKKLLKRFKRSSALERRYLHIAITEAFDHGIDLARPESWSIPLDSLDPAEAICRLKKAPRL